MPSKQTSNYNLSQWVKTDKVLMDDFNEDNSKIDAALTKKADQSALDSLKKTVDTLSGTVSGHTSSLNSHTSSLSKLGNCQIYTDTYTGDGGTVKSLTFPGYPVFVFVQRQGFPGHMTFIRNGGCGAGDYGNSWAIPTWTATGLSWKMETDKMAELNTNGSDYAVFALLDMSR